MYNGKVSTIKVHNGNEDADEVEVVDTYWLPSMIADGVSCSLQISWVLIQSCSCTLSHAGAPNVTELTLDRESRTLSCTSTGGPATTVTWTKDGAVITPNTTHQQTQMIVDTVGGIYQNTLTIAQSVTGENLYGLYSCTVENSRGSSNRIEYFYGKISKPVHVCSLE